MQSFDPARRPNCRSNIKPRVVCIHIRSAPAGRVASGWSWRFALTPEGRVEIVIYPTPVELKGGIVEGTVVFPGFSLDLHQLISVFDRVDEINWRAHGFGPWDHDGPHISIEGTYQKHNVWLQVLAEAPDDAEPGMKLDTTGKRLKIAPNN